MTIRTSLIDMDCSHFPEFAGLGLCFSASSTRGSRGGASKSRKHLGRKGSSTATRKTTSRGGGRKSAQARARAHARRSAAGASSNASPGAPGTAYPSPARADLEKPGPGDIRQERIEQRR